MIEQYSNTASQQESDIDITPMLDVVFIMLIFFIVTASFVKEQGVPIYVPQPLQLELVDLIPPIVVKITERQEVQIQDRLVDVRAIRANIVRLKAENPHAPVVVKVDGKAKTNLLIKAIDGVRAAQVAMPPITLAAG